MTTSSLKKAAELLKQGELVAFPTETVYGLGANALDESAVAKIFALKGRPSNNPLIVHCHSPIVIKDLAISNERIEKQLKLLSKFWPGPLSVILPKKANVPHITTGGLDTVAVRIPNHPIALELLKISNLPIAAPSANPSNYVSPTTADHVRESFGKNAPYILDGGACSVGIESTVVSLATSKPTIFRLGAITKEDLETALSEEVLVGTAPNESPLSPGQLSVHYTPKTSCVLEGAVEISNYPTNTGLISFTNNNSANYSHIVTLSNSGSLEEAARRFYAALREMDQLNLDLIVIEPCTASGIGEALMDRISRATARVVTPALLMLGMLAHT